MAKEKVLKTSPVFDLEAIDEVRGLSCGYPYVDFVSRNKSILFARGVIHELFGPKSSNKTTLLLETISYNQFEDPGFTVLFIDAEGTIAKSIKYAQQLGVSFDKERFLYKKPITFQDAADYVLRTVKKQRVDLIVIDTLAALRPQEELDKGFSKSKQKGLRGYLASEFLRNLNADLDITDPYTPAIIIINQMFVKLNIDSFGPPRTEYDTTASSSLQYYAGSRYELMLGKKFTHEEENPYTGDVIKTPFMSQIRLKAEKNKIGMPYNEIMFYARFGHGIDVFPTLVDAGKNKGVLKEGGGGRLSLDTEETGKLKSVPGYERFIEHLRNDDTYAKALASSISEFWEWQLDTYYRWKAPERLATVIEESDLSDIEEAATSVLVEEEVSHEDI